MTEWDEEEERAERVSEVKRNLAQLLEHEGIVAEPYELERDVMVHGPLTVLMEFCRDNRSEIEELQ